MTSRSRFLCLIVATLVAACSNEKSAQTRPSGSPLNCGDVAALDSYPSDTSWHGVKIGKLFFSSFATGQDHAVISDFDSRYPTKVLIQPTDPLVGSLKLEGWRCSNGERLRFEYAGSWNEPVATLMPAGSAPNGTPVGYTGYMLFTAPGKWKVSVIGSDDKAVGSAVLLVQTKVQ